jgi:hypothetical protein
MTTSMTRGHVVDRIAGQLSHALHGLRGPKENTVQDLEQYLDRPLVDLFPAPPPPSGFRSEDTWYDRRRRTTTLSWKSSHVTLSSEYRLRHEHQYRRNLTAWARWVRPDGVRRKKCLVYVHGWLEPGSWIEEYFMFPGWGRELDVDLVHVALPFHGVRNPRTSLFSGEYFWTGDLVRSVESIRQAVCDARTLVQWMRGQGYESVGALGISFGGSIAMLLACLPPVPDYVIAIAAHLAIGEASESAEILWRAKRDLERWGVHEPERRRIWQRLGIDTAQPVLPPDRQLWIEAREDAHIDPALVRKQWEEWSHPNLHWIPGGHMTFPLHMADITRAMAAFVRDK